MWKVSIGTVRIFSNVLHVVASKNLQSTAVMEKRYLKLCDFWLFSTSYRKWITKWFQSWSILHGWVVAMSSTSFYFLFFLFAVFFHDCCIFNSKRCLNTIHSARWVESCQAPANHVLGSWGFVLGKYKKETVSVTSEYPQDGSSVCFCYDFRVDMQLQKCMVRCVLHIISV